MTDSERVAESARSFLDDHPDAEDALRELVDADREGPWEFEDTRLDSGRFGELVSRAFVESVDGDYRFVDRDAVRMALGEEPVESTTEESDDVDIPLSLPSIDVRVGVGLFAALAAVVAARLLAYRSVFREGYVVSPGNDPYFYRYWQEQLFQEGGNATAVEMLSNVPGDGRAMTHYSNWFLADLLGGTPDAAEPVVAWVPIVSAVLTALCVYGIAVLVTDDQRISLAAVAFLALTPVHAVYTQLGFLEHRSHQYVWLGVLVLALAWFAVDVTRRLDDADGHTVANEHARSPLSWAVAGVLALAVFGSAFSWAGSPLTFVPVAVYLGFRVIGDVRADVSPLRANAPALAGLAAGSCLVVVMHVHVGWDRSIAVAAPILVTLGGIGVAVVAALWQSLDRSAAELLAVETLLAAALGGAYWQLRPDDIARLSKRAGDLFGRETATETASVLATDNGIILSPLAWLGPGLYLALVPMAVATYFAYRRYEPGWLLLSCFAWYYLVLAAIQVRFGSHLSFFVSIFAAVALVFVLAKIDLVREPVPFSGDSLDGPPLGLPDSSTVAGYTAGIVAVVLLVNLLFLPGFISSAAYSDDQFDAAMAIANHTDTVDRHHSEFVLSHWGDNRMYNYFATGDSHRDIYARRNHEPFVTASDPDESYGPFFGDVGYVVLEDRSLPADTAHTQLFDEFGAGEPALGHYQLLYSSNDTRAFVVVRGATITATGPANETVTVRTDVSRAGESFTYERTAQANETGIAAIRVAYPGTYDVGGGPVRVNESNVVLGDTVRADDERRTDG